MEKDHGDYVAAEREVLTAVVHPYIVTLQYSFQTTSKLYLLLDFINGGHLFFQLYREVREAFNHCRTFTLSKCPATPPPPPPPFLLTTVENNKPKLAGNILGGPFTSLRC